MADETATPEESADELQEGMPPIGVNAQYIKDLSFEAPGAPAIYAAMQENSPDVQISVNVEFGEFGNNIFEVVLKIESRCTVGDDIAFLLELEYGGLFTLNVEDEIKGPVLSIECPRLLFPFARNILADVSRDGGFPPLMLGPIDFAQLYQAEMEKHSAAQANPAGTDA